MSATTLRRPRNVDAPRAAAILYGDWGTSKIYVIGLAFGIMGYSSFWLIAAMCLLTALVGINYMLICKHYPDGGGVYSSVRHRSAILSIAGAFLLIADYIVTAALSALSAFEYFGVPNPALCAALVIAVIGALNFFGPRHTGGLAFLVAVPAVIVVVLLFAFSLPHLGVAVSNLQPLHGDLGTKWKGFVGVVLALSGVEAVANTTGVMKLNPNSTLDKPSVTKTSTPAIFWVMVEVCIFTVLLSLATHALPGLQLKDGEVMAGDQHVRDSLLRYMAEIFVSNSLGAMAGQIAGWVVTIVFGVLLFSAVNTAIVDLISITYLMSRDRELPPVFGKLNRFGVPTAGMVVATVIPVMLVLVVKDMAAMAALYAIGVVGAIATNLGACSTDRKLGLAKWERVLMFSTFVVMLAIELSLFVDKPNARSFAMTILAVGLILRGLSAERLQKKLAMGKETVPLMLAPTPPSTTSLTRAGSQTTSPRKLSAEKVSAILVAANAPTAAFDFAFDQARLHDAQLYVLFVRPIAVNLPIPLHPMESDPEAMAVFEQARQRANNVAFRPLYAISDDPAATILDVSASLGVNYLIMGGSHRTRLEKILRGDMITAVARNLPENIKLLIYG